MQAHLEEERCDPLGVRLGAGTRFPIRIRDVRLVICRIEVLPICQTSRISFVIARETKRTHPSS